MESNRYGQLKSIEGSQVLCGSVSSKELLGHVKMGDQQSNDTDSPGGNVASKSSGNRVKLAHRQHSGSHFLREYRVHLNDGKARDDVNVACDAKKLIGLWRSDFGVIVLAECRLVSKKLFAIPVTRRVPR